MLGEFERVIALMMGEWASGQREWRGCYFNMVRGAEGGGESLRLGLRSSPVEKKREKWVL